MDEISKPVLGRMDYKMTDIIKLALDAGFTQAGEMNMDAMIFRPEVRDMCAADRCHNYGRCWTCPPYCGTLEESRERTSHYDSGILVQCTGDMEDDFDYETIQETMKNHRAAMHSLIPVLKEKGLDILAFGGGGCGLCEKCTCPDEPCRHPDMALSSMEAYGMVVNDVCTASGIPYNYGRQKMTFTGCILYKKNEAEALGLR